MGLPGSREQRYVAATVKCPWFVSGQDTQQAFIYDTTKEGVCCTPLQIHWATYVVGLAITQFPQTVWSVTEHSTQNLQQSHGKWQVSGKDFLEMNIAGKHLMYWLDWWNRWHDLSTRKGQGHGCQCHQCRWSHESHRRNVLAELLLLTCLHNVLFICLKKKCSWKYYWGQHTWFSRHAHTDTDTDTHTHTHTLTHSLTPTRTHTHTHTNRNKQMALHSHSEMHSLFCDEQSQYTNSVGLILCMLVLFNSDRRPQMAISLTAMGGHKWPSLQQWWKTTTGHLFNSDGRPQMAISIGRFRRGC